MWAGGTASFGTYLPSNTTSHVAPWSREISIIWRTRALQWLSLLDPIRHFFQILRGAFLKGDGMLDLWRQYAILAAMAAGALSLAIRRFGKHPDLRPAHAGPAA